MSWWPRYKLVVDTNVFVSGLLFGGKPGRILEFINQELVTLVTSPEIEAEMLRKLEKFGVGDNVLDGITALFEYGSERVIPVVKLKISRDLKDNIFLEAAAEAGADFLVSGDKDLLVLEQIGKTKIVRPNVTWKDGGIGFAKAIIRTNITGGQTQYLFSKQL